MANCCVLRLDEQAATMVHSVLVEWQGQGLMEVTDSPDVVIAKRLRKRTSSLIVSDDALTHCRVEGSALDVLNEVLTWEPRP
ncbi:MAG: hypothetical protein ACRES5_24750 [Pseudomonas sp.]